MDRHPRFNCIYFQDELPGLDQRENRTISASFLRHDFVFRSQKSSGSATRPDGRNATAPVAFTDRLEILSCWMESDEVLKTSP